MLENNRMNHLALIKGTKTKISQDTCTFPVVKVAGVNLKGFDVPNHVSTK